MKIHAPLIIASFCALSTCQAMAAAPMPAGGKPAGYKLVWADEFDQPGLPDASKWQYDTSMNKTGWANEELQYYAKARLENTRVANGKLLITARNEKLTGASDFGGQAYSSGRLYTRGKFEFTYGFVEVRAKLPCGLGTWPAIWMLGTGAGWPEQGEIDIMEHSGMKKGEVLASLHTGAFNWPNKTQITAPTRVETVCDAFHNYQLTWDAEHITIGVDNKNFLQFANPKDGDHHKWPFSDPQYLILNVAIGGMMGGPVDNKIFPVTMAVDYVRVYQR
ncbi:MAG TPA: glycoside hydrolase family 16 protein [Telluria sp.]|nr:glycoside hydrolase family 16 protein [Telluria sp.]